MNPKERYELIGLYNFQQVEEIARLTKGLEALIEKYRGNRVEHSSIYKDLQKLLEDKPE